MTYEHKGDSRRFDLPNPMKVENLLRAITGGITLALGILLLFESRGSVPAGELQWGSAIPAFLLVALGAKMLLGTATQLRFFFGRGRPASLDAGPQRLKPWKVNALKENLRHQSIVYPEPIGPLAGLLHSLIQNLVYAPQFVRNLAQAQFNKAVRVAFLLLFVLMTLLATGAGTASAPELARAQAWMGLGGMIWIVLLLSFTTGVSHSGSKASIGWFGIASYTSLAILGPFLLAPYAKLFPDLDAWTPYPHIFILITLAFCAFGLAFRALLKEGNEPPPTGVSQVQEAWSMNGHPAQVMGEFGRLMQESWRDQIPNRVYSRLEPQIAPGSRAGSFSGEAMEELQPMPITRQDATVLSQLADPTRRPLVLLTAFSALMSLLGALSLFAFGLGTPAGGPFGVSSPHWLLYAFTFLPVAALSHAISHALWARFDFDSAIIWFEMQGQFASSELQHGNVVRDTLKTTSSVIQIESMTYRLWVAKLRTVSFGKDAPRAIWGIEPELEAATSITDRLRAFSQNQAIILAPTAQADGERHQKLIAMNQAAAAPSALAPPSLPAAAAIPTLGQEPILARFCSACGNGIQPEHRFCNACGVAL